MSDNPTPNTSYWLTTAIVTTAVVTLAALAHHTLKDPTPAEPRVVLTRPSEPVLPQQPTKTPRPPHDDNLSDRWANNPCLTSLLAQVPPGAEIPAHVVMSVMLTESQYYYGDRVLPNPYAVNAAGKGYHAHTKEDALSFIRRQSTRNIDRGCMQINYRAHPAAFTSHAEALDPARNVAYGVSFLKRLHQIPLCFIGEARRVYGLPRHRVPSGYRAWYDRMHSSKMSRTVACYHNAASPMKQMRYLKIFDSIREKQKVRPIYASR